MDRTEMHDLEWHEANYRLLLTQEAGYLQRLAALEALLQEQYVAFYMTECAALFFLTEREIKGRRMAKKQCTLFPGEACMELAQRLLEEGTSCAAEVLAQLERQRGAGAVGARSGADVTDLGSGSAAREEKPSAPPACLPEPVQRCVAGLAGMERAASVLSDLHAAVHHQRARATLKLRTQLHCHLIIRGGPGSGKSLLAERISALLYELGISTEAAPCILEGHSLTSFIGEDGSGLEDALAPLDERTVVIDGLAALFQDNKSKVNVPALLHTVLERFAGRVNFILLGMEQDVAHLLTLEPTMAGQFLYDMRLGPYTLDELVEIAQCIAQDKGYVLSQQAHSALRRKLEREYRGASFRGGKSLEAAVNLAAQNLARRIARTGAADKGVLMRLEEEDIAHGDEGADPDALLAQLDALTGLSAVKEQVRRLTALARANQEAQRLGLSSAGFGTLHMVFMGNAGTGKTTVARIIGGIYRALGILPQGDKVVECVRADLVGQYVGHTAPRVKAKVAEALGGVLFIDEAYALCGEKDSFGREAVDTLVSEIENHRADLMVILAGYSDEMNKFLDQNQGLASRFPNQMEFADYSLEEMEQIFLGMLSGAGKRLEEGTGELLRTYIAEHRSKRGFGNARGIRNLRDRLIETQSLRLDGLRGAGTALMAEDFTVILAEDLEKLVEGSSKTRDLKDWMAQLRNLTGLQSVKEQVERKVYMILAQQQMNEQNIGKGGAFGTLHMVFRGNAGTGKTTVARIMAGIYNTLGLLPDGETFVECSRSELVGGYQGQTALKVKEVVNRAIGGVLFVDEAYSLCRDAHDSFGREAVDALIAHMENHRKELMVILAGYSADMDAFFEHNQGMASRVPTSLTFEDYTQEALFEIFCNIIAGRGFQLGAGVDEVARQLIAQESQTRNFGNARGVRNLAERVVECHSARLGQCLSRGETPTREDYVIIRREDISGKEEK